GSGVFGLPSLVAGLVGGAAPLAYLAAAAGMGVIMACFAEVASRFREAGGPYLYARVAFGRFAGIEIAWLTWLARLTAAAGNANLFVIYLSEFWPRASNLAPRLAVLTLLVGFLAAVNYRGVRAGAHLSDFFTVAKLLPLAAFVVTGLFFVDWRNLVVRSPAAGTSRPSSQQFIPATARRTFPYSYIRCWSGRSRQADRSAGMLRSRPPPAFLPMPPPAPRCSDCAGGNPPKRRSACRRAT